MLRLLIWTGKGGTGKTTSVGNLGAVLAMLGLRVLMLGLDPSGDLESSFAVEEDHDNLRVETVMTEGGDPAAAVVNIPLPARAKRGGRLSLLPCSSELDALGDAIAADFNIVRRLLDTFEGDFDVVLIDAQGTLTSLSHAAARAADCVLFTMEPGYFEFRALSRRLAQLEKMEQDEGWSVDPLGVLFVRTASRSKDMREYREHLSDPAAFGVALHVFTAHTRQQGSVRSDPRSGGPTVLVAPDSNVAKDYWAAGRELLTLIRRRSGAA